MGECLFQANGLNHDVKFLAKTSHGTTTEQHPVTNRSVTSTRSISCDEWEKWIERNSSRNDKDKDICDRQPPNRHEPSKEEADWKYNDLKSHTTGQRTAVLSCGRKKETKTPRNDQQNERRNYEMTNQETSNPPPLIDESEGWESHAMSTPSKSLEQCERESLDKYNTMIEAGEDTRTLCRTQQRYEQLEIEIDRNFNPITNGMSNSLEMKHQTETDDEMVEFFESELAIMKMIQYENSHHKQTQFNGHEATMKKKMISSNTGSKDIDENNEMIKFIRKEFDNNRKEDEICSNCLGYDSDSNKTLRLICNRLYTIDMSGAAKELEALLRRCIYPKRDVIRWI